MRGPAFDTICFLDSSPLIATGTSTRYMMFILAQLKRDAWYVYEVRHKSRQIDIEMQMYRAPITTLATENRVCHASFFNSMFSS